MSPPAGWLLLLSLVCAPASVAGQPVDRRAEIRNLYATANYEETLSLLALIDSSPDASLRANLRDDLDEYRALCLLALAREADAARAMTALVTRHPVSLDRLEERSPKFVALYQQVRASMAPQLAAAAYAAGKQHYDAGDYTSARARLRESLALLQFAPREGAAPELEMLASGFLALAEKAPGSTGVPLPVGEPVTPALPAAPAPVAAPPPVQAAVPTPELVAVSEGGPAVPALPADPAPESGGAVLNPVEPPPFAPVPRVYTADDSDVTAPVIIDQALPRWTPPHALVRRRSYTGRVQLVIGADGRVKAADIVQPSFALYDEQVLRATRSWRYQPATKRGVPVEFKRVIEFTLSGQ